MKALLLPLSLFIFLVSILDRHSLKANHGFSLHVIEAPIPPLPDRNPCLERLPCRNPTPSGVGKAGLCLVNSLNREESPPFMGGVLQFPREVFSQPFHYLGRGAQSFVFESEDQKTVLKFYRFPSHLRRFPWTRHPFGYLFSSSRKNIKEYNLRRLELSFHSFALAATPLANETGVLYVHLQPTTELEQKVHLIDKLGVQYELPLDPIAFVVQKRGVSFLPLFKEHLAQNKVDSCKKMLKGLIEVIKNRCKNRITDLDNMDNDNYGWLEDRAIHLDIGRFQECETLDMREEILRITHPLTRYLSEISPELHDYYLSQINESVP